MLGTEKLEKIVKALAKLGVAGKKIAADKKVGIDDLAHVIALVGELDDMIDAFGDLGKALDEGKDLDVAEVIKLIQLVHAEIKAIEKA
jgi:hypothetical protein